MEALETLLTNGGEITFTALFVALLWYVMKTNDKREEQYRETINSLSKALSGYEDLKEKINDLYNKITLK
jgi:hypothetical protein